MHFTHYVAYGFPTRNITSLQFQTSKTSSCFFITRNIRVSWNILDVKDLDVMLKQPFIILKDLFTPYGNFSKSDLA